MDQRQKQRAEYKTWGKAYYHLCTDGKTSTICHDEGEYVYLVNTISLIDLLFPIKVHAYEVMRSHVHLLLSGRGEDCVAVFDYLKKRVNTRLREDGHQTLPPSYGFKLIPVKDEEQMRDNFVYIARNASQVLNIRPGCYIFGSAFSFYSGVTHLAGSIRAGDCPVRDMSRLFRTHAPIPPDRRILPGLKMALPQGFVDMSVLYKVFPTAKEYEIRLVKDYEAYVEVAGQLGEEVAFSLEEARDIVDMELVKSGRSLSDLSREDRCQLAVQLAKRFRLNALTLSQVLFIPVRIVSQMLRSKQR
ncbi:MAG: hypothetical protein IKN06_06280 [Bacteroidales bacterium]|nr:hypothetical protein [Bacteroidales bacterium]